MTETAFPFPPGAPAGDTIGAVQWRQWMLRAMGTPGVYRFGGMLAASVGSGLHVVFADGEAQACGTYYNNSAPVTLAFGSNSSGQDRYDYVAIHFDWSANTAALTVIAGTPGSGLPALTQNSTTAYDIGLCAVHVGPSAANILSSDIFPLLDRFASAPGGLPVGALIAWPGDETHVPAGYALGAGQSINTMQIPKLAAVLPAFGSGQQYGNNGATCVMPDTRGRTDVSPDNLGVAAGVASAAGRITSVTATAGKGIGAQTFSLDDMPNHVHHMDVDINGNPRDDMYLSHSPGTGFYGSATASFAPLAVGHPDTGQVRGQSGGTGTGAGARIQPSLVIPKIVKLY